jgi:hypothetical protein
MADVQTCDVGAMLSVTIKTWQCWYPAPDILTMLNTTVHCTVLDMGAKNAC